MRGQGTHVHYSEVSWSSLKKLLPYLWRYKQRLVLSISLLIAAKVASITLPFVLKHIVDGLDTPLNQAIAVPLALLIAYGAVRLANVLFSELRDTVFGRVTEHAMHDIALKVFKHLHNLDLAFHLDRKTGGLGRDIDRGTNGISFLLRFMVFNIIPTLLEIILVMVILSGKYSWIFGLIVFLAISSYIAWSVWATERRTKFVREMNKADSDTNTRAVDSLLNFETVKYFGNEDYEASCYDKNLSQWENARRNNRLSIFALNGGQATIISIFMTLAMIFAAYQVSQGHMTLGDFVLINAFMMQIFMPLNFLGFVYREMKGAMANIEKLFDLLSVKTKIIEKDKAQDLIVKKGSIDIDDISFSYNAKRKVIDNLTVSIKENSKVAIVGSSGSGKSTISKLLFRFYDCDAGHIKIDGQDISDVSLHSLRQAIAFVPQDTVLFNSSIYENIRYGCVEASESDINKAIKLAHLEKFISSLPDGLDTLVGERGLKLSGGEKQRVAIARCILKNPKILIFDEATSSLDSESEKEILKAVEEISENKTCIMIAHRLSTIANADHIIVIEDGKVLEQGNHTELIAKQSRYSELWSLQENDD
ncbi:ABC transporter ATP-binding protein/permease [Agaribacterium sp. ZY112]|uniref:ABCB family ABC transporter ATP-binding protein/permease n=1 Tax=Agaribacterium sp. ZY112 TaxID=3233574 RepID=UPI0035235FE0